MPSALTKGVLVILVIGLVRCVANQMSESSARRRFESEHEIRQRRWVPEPPKPAPAPESRGPEGGQSQGPSEAPAGPQGEKHDRE